MAAIRNVIGTAFAGLAHSNHKEHILVERLRQCAALSVSLVAELDSQVIGHVAFSPVSIDGIFCAWYGLARLAVLPKYQRIDIGARLVHAGLNSPRKAGATGCVVLDEAE